MTQNQFDAFCSLNLTPLHGKPVLETYANRADPVQMPLNAASDQGLHYLLTTISMQNSVRMKTGTRTPKNLNGLI